MAAKHLAERDEARDVVTQRDAKIAKHATELAHALGDLAEREKTYTKLRGEYDGFREEAVARVRGLEQRVRETEERVAIAETQRDVMTGELDIARHSLEEAWAKAKADTAR